MVQISGRTSDDNNIHSYRQEQIIQLASCNIDSRVRRVPVFRNVVLHRKPHDPWATVLHRYQYTDATKSGQVANGPTVLRFRIPWTPDLRIRKFGLSL